MSRLGVITGLGNVKSFKSTNTTATATAFCGSVPMTPKTLSLRLNGIRYNTNLCTSAEYIWRDSNKGSFTSSIRPQSGGSIRYHTTSTTAQPGGKFVREENEDFSVAWKRNLDEAREWRKKQSIIKSSLPLFLPSPFSQSQQSKKSPTQTTLSTLLASGAALGHSPTYQNRSFTPYIYGTRSNLSIIDLDQTLPILRRTAAMVRDVVRSDGIVLFVGTKKGHEGIIRKAVERLGDNGFGTNEWVSGVLTNAETVFGIKPIENKSYLPDLVFFLNPSENLGGIKECTIRNVPTIGIVDTDTDPRIVTYPIPANMESLRTAELIAGTLSLAGQEGRRLRLIQIERKGRKGR